MTARRELRDHVARRRPGAVLQSIAGDASTRRFWRELCADGGSRVVMDYGAPFVDETDDVSLTRIFRDAGLPVAELIAVEPELGCLWFEDLGSLTLEQALEERSEREGLLSAAVKLAAAIAQEGSPALARSERRDGPALDEERFRFEMRFFVEHYVQGLCGKPASGELSKELERLADDAARTPRRVLCHRDFHSRNLMVRADETLAMVDIQDARWGPDSYDLASLLFDGYIQMESPTRDRLYAEFVALAQPAEGFEHRFERVALQRTIKALGTFGHQASVMDNRRYLEAVPRTLERIEGLLQRAESAAPLRRAWIESGLAAD